MDTELSLTEKQQAEALHKRIKAFGSIIMQSFYPVANNYGEPEIGQCTVLGYRPIKGCAAGDNGRTGRGNALCRRAFEAIDRRRHRDGAEDVRQ